jgi:hypothetical protein
MPALVAGIHAAPLYAAYSIAQRRGMMAESRPAMTAVESFR